MRGGLCSLVDPLSPSSQWQTAQADAWAFHLTHRSPDALPSRFRHIGVGGGTHRSDQPVGSHLVVVASSERDHTGIERARAPPAGGQVGEAAAGDLA